MKEAIIYGGAFNPPTKAHQAVLQACIETAKQSDSEVWLLLSGDRRDKQINTSVEQRLKLAQALCDSVIAGDIKLRIETLELLSDQPTETYETNQNLNEMYPRHRFTWVFGADSIQTMPTWKDGEWLTQNLGMLVVPRAGIQIPVLPMNAKVMHVDVPPISSTIVRGKIANGDPIEEYVPQQVCSVLKYS